MSDINDAELVDGVTPITDESIERFIETGGQTPSYHTILEVWQKTLEPSRTEREERINPSWANTMVSQYMGLGFGDLVRYRDDFYNKVIALLDILEAEIATDKECLSYTEAEEDSVENRVHYLNVLLAWQQQLLQWELDWDCEDPEAAIQVAAMSETHKMFFGQMGLTQYLDNIRLEITEADQAEWSEVLTAQRDGA